ncbi:NUDIX domain-containing protein [Streptomyces hoynatensis]|uniref:NUDIX domain-containing protein n=1 Tax=Streptomyces hoynatensis TaxID=1141874 RepID=A0A3A9YSQ3_9ACTN|nr:NUDIX domain-containing protein [Streptomyces hoynatensis]RKN38995.1 NUDIX domain-containing protein [Streptomyces hoynatensis]
MAAAVLTVDLVVLGNEGAGWHLLLIRRGKEPCRGRWALPGGKVGEEEDAARAACRELAEETGLRASPAGLVPLSWRTAPGRDPRGRYASLVYAVPLPWLPRVSGGDDAAAAWWQPLAELPWDEADAKGTEDAKDAEDAYPGRAFAFDHAEILREALPGVPRGGPPEPSFRAATWADVWQLGRLAGAGGRAACRALAGDADAFGAVRVAAVGGFLIGCSLPAPGEPNGRLVRVSPHWLGRGVEEGLAADAPPRGGAGGRGEGPG